MWGNFVVSARNSFLSKLAYIAMQMKTSAVTGVIASSRFSTNPIR